MATLKTLRWDIECLYGLLSKTRHQHGAFLGKVSLLKGSVGESGEYLKLFGLKSTDWDANAIHVNDGEDPLIYLAMVYLRSLLQVSEEHDVGSSHNSLTTAQDIAKRLHIPTLSAQIEDERVYMERVLERTSQTLSNANPDVSEWVEWFLYCVQSAIEESDKQLEPFQKEQEFWFHNGTKIDNERQQKMVTMLLDGFEEKLTTTVWALLTDCSQDTALRDIQDLVEKGILMKLPGGGRSTAYQIVRS